MTRPMRPSRLLPTETARPPAGGEVEMPPTTAPRIVAPPGSPRTAPGSGPPLPRQRPQSPTESAPAAGPRTTDDHAAATAPHDRLTGVTDAGSGTDEAVTATASFDGHDEQHDGAWALVKSSQEGDMAAFGELFDRYYDVVFRYVLFRMGDRTLAEDITQETFVRALRRITSVSYQGRDIGAWFVTIARNLIFDHVKSSRYRLEQTTSEIIELSPSTSGPEQQVLDGATNEELLRCVRKLNPDQQECIRLRFLQGLSVAETARMMDRNEGAVKALQHRAVRRLAQLLPEGLR
jgi:RNA polymerase sigma factor, sigma-70 family